MKISEVARRYARALYELSAEAGQVERVLNEVRILEEALISEELSKTLFSPAMRPPELKEMLSNALKETTASDLTKSLLQLLAEKKRLNLFSQIGAAYEEESDKANGVVRGLVRSAARLGIQERASLEETMSRTAKKKVILEYKESPELLGGLIAQVGSYTLDDSLESQLRLMQDEIKRSVVEYGNPRG